MPTYRKYLVTHGVQYGAWSPVPEEQAAKPWTYHTNAYIVPDFYCHSLATFRQMADEARKDFPELKDKDVTCSTVLVSSWCKGMPVIWFPVPPHTGREGWMDCKERLPDIAIA